MDYTTESGFQCVDEPCKGTVTLSSLVEQWALQLRGYTKCCPNYSHTARTCMDSLIREMISEEPDEEFALFLRDLIRDKLPAARYEETIRNCGTKMHCDGTKI